MFSHLSLKNKLLFAFGVSIIPTFIATIFVLNLFRDISEPIRTEIPKNIALVTSESTIDSLTLGIGYYNESIYLSILNYENTGNISWKKRYQTDSASLEQISVRYEQLNIKTNKSVFESMLASRRALAEMESASIRFYEQNNQEKALAILKSDEYLKYNKILNEALTSFMEGRGASFEQINYTGIKALQDSNREILNTLDTGILTILLSVILALLLFIFWGTVFTNHLMSPLKDLEKTALAIANGNESIRVAITSNDEIGKLGNAINLIADNLINTKTEIEAKIAERTSDLEKLNSYMVGRELKMVELKKELNALKKV